MGYDATAMRTPMRRSKRPPYAAGLSGGAFMPLKAQIRFQASQKIDSVEVSTLIRVPEVTPLTIGRIKVSFPVLSSL